MKEEGKGYACRLCNRCKGWFKRLDRPSDRRFGAVERKGQKVKLQKGKNNSYKQETKA